MLTTTYPPSRAATDWRDVWFSRLVLFLPCVLVAALTYTNRWFTELDDECAIIDRAARPFREIIGVFLHGVGQHEHPPLYDLVLHGWLRLTGGEIQMLRIPSIVFYVLGAWILAKVATHLGGRMAGLWTLLLILLWPYGFHYGRVATWYSFCFFLVSLVTFSYFRYLRRPNVRTWIWLFLSCLALVYSNYFGWAILACVAFDFMVAAETRQGGRRWTQIAAMTGMLGIAYIPICRAFRREIRVGVHANHSSLAVVLTGIYNLYCLYVSESVAPWFWSLGVLAGVAIAVCLWVTFRNSSTVAKRLFLYFCTLFVLMTVLGIIEPKRTMLISAWLILPTSLTIATTQNKHGRRIILASLALLAAIGWYGIVCRRLYAAPHWTEPWSAVAEEAADVIHRQGTVIGDNPSFFFYLTYDVSRENGTYGKSKFAGLMPDSVRVPGAFDSQQWVSAGKPTTRTMLIVEGVHYDIPSGPILEARGWLAAHCELTRARQLVRDRGAAWKQRFLPSVEQPVWRVVILTYACD